MLFYCKALKRPVQITSILETRTIETQIESDVNLLQCAGGKLNSALRYSVNCWTSSTNETGLF